MTVLDQFDLGGRVAVITGGAGLLGVQHAEAVAEAGGVAVLLDLDRERLGTVRSELAARFGDRVRGIPADVTRRDQLEGVLREVTAAHGGVDILINNAASNPKLEAQQDGPEWTRLESYPAAAWEHDLAVGLGGALYASQVFGGEMARRGGGVILNIASDLGVIAPDQRLYRRSGVAAEQQPVKPVSYSVVKHGLIGLTKYLATYWAEHGVRVNALSPGGVFAGQDPGFVTRLSALIPLGRMAHEDEYKAAVVFLVSDASSYMTGANLVVDGGRSVW